MKSVVTKIAIANPCSQNWEMMDKYEDHRFCESCSKCVIDFSEKTNLEIISILSQHNGTVCGRLTQTQLDQLSYYTLIAPKNNNWLKYLGVLAIGLATFAQDAKAIVKEQSINIEQPYVLHAKDEPKPLMVTSIFGYVLDENKTPLAGVRVRIDQTKLYAITDKNGKYVIKITPGFNFNNKLLLVETIGMKGKLKINYATKKQNNLTVEPISFIMGEVVVTKFN